MAPSLSSLVLPYTALGDAPNHLDPRRRLHLAGRRAGQWIAVFWPSSRRDAGGNYSCQAKNRHGQDRVAYLLAVVVFPPTPHLRFAASNFSSVTLQWSMSGSQNNLTTKKISPVRSFILKFRPSRPAEFQQHEWRERILPAEWSSVRVGDLDCGSRLPDSNSTAMKSETRASSDSGVTIGPL